MRREKPSWITGFSQRCFSWPALKNCRKRFETTFRNEYWSLAFRHLCWPVFETNADHSLLKDVRTVCYNISLRPLTNTTWRPDLPIHLNWLSMLCWAIREVMSWPQRVASYSNGPSRGQMVKYIFTIRHLSQDCITTRKTKKMTRANKSKITYTNVSQANCSRGTIPFSLFLWNSHSCC